MKLSTNHLMLIVLLLAGIGMCLHLGEPAHGYHNWKLAHYTSEAVNFAEDGWLAHGFLVPERMWSGEDNFTGVHSDTLPTYPLVLSVVFKAFGQELWLARLVNVIATFIGLLFFYLFMKKITNSGVLSFISTTILSFFPITQFFGQNPQLLAFALMFCMMGCYYFERWKETRKNWHLFITCTMLCLGFLTKYTFFIIPLAVILSMKKEDWKAFWKKKARETVIIPFAFTIAWVVHMTFMFKMPGDNAISSEMRINLLQAFAPSFFNAMKGYLLENYAFLGVLLLVIGLCLSIFSKGVPRFMKALTFLAPFWILIMANKMTGHSYHQYPLLPLIAFLIALPLYMLWKGMAKVPVSFIRHVGLSILLAILVFSLWTANARLYNTQFVGLDVAGDYISHHAQEGDSMMHSGHQSYGVLWHASIPGTKAPRNASWYEYFEQKKGLKYVFLYKWGLDRLNYPDVRAHLEQNYVPVMAGVQEKQLIFLLLKKDDTGFSLNGIQETFINSHWQKKIYTNGETLQYGIKY